MSAQLDQGTYTITILQKGESTAVDSKLWDDVVKYDSEHTAPMIVDMCEYFAAEQKISSDGSVPRSPRGDQAGEWKQTHRWNTLGKGFEQCLAVDSADKEKFGPSYTKTVTLAYIRKLRGILSKASLRFDMRASSMNEIAEELKFLVSEEYELNSTQAASLAKTLKAQQSFVEQSSTKLERRDKDRLAHMATSERSLIMIGDVDYVDEPIATFVRLSDPIPFLGGQSDAASADENRSTRFVFLLLGPPGSMSHLESKEMGRVMALALQNSHFHKATEIAGTRAQLLGNLDGFMEAQEVVTTDAQEGSSSEGCMASCFPKHRIEGGVLVGGLARGGFRTARTNIEAERFLYQREQRQKMSQVFLSLVCFLVSWCSFPTSCFKVWFVIHSDQA